MTEDDKTRISAAKHQWVITDPYPGLSLYQQRESMRGPLEKLFGIFVNDDTKPEISVHKAWQDGFTFAWELVEKKLREIPTEEMRYFTTPWGPVEITDCTCTTQAGIKYTNPQCPTHGSAGVQGGQLPLNNSINNPCICKIQMNCINITPQCPVHGFQGRHE